MGFPSTFPPKSSTAILAMRTEPWPPISAYKLDMSFSTPIFTTLPETCACAAMGTKASPTATAQRALRRKILVFIGFHLLAIALRSPVAGIRPVCMPSLKRMPRLDTQVLVQLLVVRLQFVPAKVLHDLSVFHDVVAIRHGLGKAEILFHQQDGESPFLDLPDDLPDALHDNRGKAFRRFVQQEQRCAGAQDSANSQHLLFPTRQLRSLAFAALV